MRKRNEHMWMRACVSEVCACCGLCLHVCSNLVRSGTCFSHFSHSWNLSNMLSVMLALLLLAGFPLLNLLFIWLIFQAQPACFIAFKPGPVLRALPASACFVSHDVLTAVLVAAFRPCLVSHLLSDESHWETPAQKWQHPSLLQKTTRLWQVLVQDFALNGFNTTHV